MPLFDLPLEELQAYLPARQEPSDFDAFWQHTLAETNSYPLNPVFNRVDYGLRTIETYDVTFNGYGGQPIKGWLQLPVQRAGVIPCVVEYIGYGGGRGFPLDWLIWSSAGYAHFIMDTRGQGSEWLRGDTQDLEPDGSSPHVPGFMTRGILDKRTYYYRRLISDATRAIQAARSHQAIDGSRLAVKGHSQGGGLSIMVSGLVQDIQIAMPDAPFLCHHRRALELIATDPYVEIAKYCKVHRNHVDTVFQTLAYFDGVNFAPRAKASALFSVAMMDEVCPPSTVFAAYNHYAGSKDIRVYHFNNHESGESFHTLEQLKFVRQMGW